MNRVQVLRKSLPKAFLEELFEGLISAYKKSHLSTKGLFKYKEERNDTLPFIRRGCIEELLKDVAIKHDLKVTTHDSGSFWHHRRIDGEQLLITQSSESGANRRSMYRLDYASKEYKRLLFSEEQIKESYLPYKNSDEMIYAILVHKGKTGYPGRLGMAEFWFPSNGYVNWYSESFDFFQMFPEIAKTIGDDSNKIILPKVENIVDQAMPELKKSNSKDKRKEG